MSDIIFVDGVKIKQKFDGLLGVSIKLDKFSKFVKEHEKDGWLNLDICKSKDKDSWYARLNTWKPDKTGSKPKEDVLIDEDEIPF